MSILVSTNKAESELTGTECNSLLFDSTTYRATALTRYALSTWYKYCFCILLGSSWSMPAGAQTQETDLFLTSVPIERRNIAARRIAEREAFERVLIKVSGSLTIALNPVINAALDRADDFILRFEFSRKLVPHKPEPQLFLKVGFDATSVLELIRSQALPVWDSGRPSILAWIVVEDEDEYRILDAVYSDVLTHTLLEQADIRGLPLFLPLFDLEQHIDPYVVFDERWELLTEAAARYGLDSMLVMTLIQEGGHWAMDWSFFWDGEASVAAGEANSLGTAMRRVVDWIADRLVSQYAITGQSNLTDTEAMQLVQVNQVSDLKAYAAVVEFFETISSVTNVQLVHVDGETLLFGVRGSGSKEQLLQLIRLNRNLRVAYGNNPSVIRLIWDS